MFSVVIVSIVLFGLVSTQDFSAPEKIRSVQFVKDTSTINKTKDGIIQLTLTNGSNVVICNENFALDSAELACRAMDFLSKGMSLQPKKSNLVPQETVIVKLNCASKNFFDCQVIFDDPGLQKCKEEGKFVHVYCIGEKDPNKFSNYKSRKSTSCTLETETIRLVRQPGLQNTGFLQLRKSTSDYWRNVCNMYFFVTKEMASMLCNRICQNSENPTPVMYLEGVENTDVGYFRDFNCPPGATSLSDCNKFDEGTETCEPIYNVALQCGDEPEKIETPPEVTCFNTSMKVVWLQKGQTLPINAQLVNLHSRHKNDSCVLQTNQNGTHVSMDFPFTGCNPMIENDDNYIIYRYTIVRSYLNEGAIKYKDKDTFDVSCNIQRTDRSIKEYQHGVVTYPPVSGVTKLRVQFSLHTTSRFENLVPKQGAYRIKFNSRVYLKYKLTDQIDLIRLSIKTCYITSVESFGDINNSNSVKIIDDFCPVKLYATRIRPFDRWNVGIQFKSFKLASSTESKIHIFCESNLCNLREVKCGFCGKRMKRSVNDYNEDSTLKSIDYLGPIILE